MSLNPFQFLTNRRPTSILASVALVVASSTFSSCGRMSTSSKTDTVEIPQTSIKDQFQIGFCWSYATMGFLESLMLKKSGITLDLSEEALGFYRMAEELVALSHKYSASELATEDMVIAKVFEGLQGWDMTFNPAYNPGFRARNAMELVQDYGVVPEYAWSYKFDSEEKSAKFLKTLYSGFAELMTKHGRGNVTREMILDLLASPDVYGSRPPQSFNYTSPNGEARRITAVELAAAEIGFTPDDYTYMIPDETINYEKIVRAMKLTLARGINVPLSYMIFNGAINEWDASHSAKNLDPNHLSLIGGHLVLITDFINKGGRPGAVSEETLRTELNRPSDDLDFVSIKNSWSTRPQSPVMRLPGYFTMDQSYIRLLSQKQTDITIVVPRDIAFAVRYGQQ